MKAFPEIKVLTDQYNASKLKVLYLNTDENPRRWEKALAFTDNLHHPDHYRFRYIDFNTLAKVGLNVYPRYLVIDQNGEVIEFRAPVPYRPYIDSLLNRVNEN